MFEAWLSKLPFILTFWTSIVLCWGVYLNVMMLRGFGTKCLQNPLIATFASTLCANIVLLLYLVFEPELAKKAGDAIVVIDVFYTCVLAAFSFDYRVPQQSTNESFDVQ